MDETKIIIPLSTAFINEIYINNMPGYEEK